MPDDKRGRDKQARDADRRQREREMRADLERGDEPEPPVETTELDEFESELESLAFPATGTEIVASVGDRAIASTGESYTVEQLLPETNAETFDSPDAVRAAVQRPTVAAAMKRVVEASETLPDAQLDWSQRKAYETTFRALESVDADDDDEGIQAITDWIVDRIHDAETLPSSRDVRRRAAEFCRANGYRIRNDEWLGV